MASKHIMTLALALAPTWVVAQTSAAPPSAPAPVPVAVPPAAAPATAARPAEPEIRVESVVIGKDEFTRMQRDILLLKKRLEETELRAQITAKTKEIEKLNMPQVAPEVPVVLKGARQTVDGDRIAQFIMGDGSSMIAREGDTLPNGMRVASIRSDSVLLRKGSVERRIGLGGTGNRPAVGAMQGMSGMPSGRPF